MTIPEGTGTGIRKILPEDGITPSHVSYPMAHTSTESVLSGSDTAPFESEIPMSVLSMQTETPLRVRPDVSAIIRSVCDTAIMSRSSCKMKKPPAACYSRGGLAETRSLMRESCFRPRCNILTSGSSLSPPSHLSAVASMGFGTRLQWRYRGGFTPPSCTPRPAFQTKV